MLVGERMTRDLIFIRDDTPLDEAMKIMRDNKVRRLPVLNDKGALIGIVSERDLLYASPSPATSLSIYELHYLMSRIAVAEVMTTEVITVTEGTPLEEAALIMADNKIGGLPVVSKGDVVGIITETDLFRIFLELLAAREIGVRLTMLVPDEKGVLAKVTGEIAELGGNIVSLGTFLGEDPTNALLTIKVQDVEEEELVKALGPLAIEMVDVRMYEEYR
ncbi:MAG: CBS and ACT domain-containing protein [Anaerolineae bacterium]